MLTFALDKKPSLRRLSWGATLAKHYHTVSTGEHNLGGCWVRWIHTVNTATSVSNGFLLPSGPTLSWSFVLKHIRLPFVG